MDTANKNIDEFDMRIVRCCASCKHSGGWLDNLHCRLHEELTPGVRAYTICKDFAPDKERVIQVIDWQEQAS